MRDFIQVNSDKIPQTFPGTLFLEILEIVMMNNIFSFGHTFWLQLTGTAMGMPAACAYATITFRQHENIHILPKFRSHLLYYKHYIDVVFGIWLPSATDNCNAWDQFKNDLNGWAGYIGKSKTLHIKLPSWISISNWQTAKYTQTLTKIA